MRTKVGRRAAVALSQSRGHPGRPAAARSTSTPSSMIVDSLAVARRASPARNTRIGLNTTGNGVDDPDQAFFENFSCSSERNYNGYCNGEIERLFELQSSEPHPGEAQTDGVGDRRQAAGRRRRPTIMWNRSGHLLAALRQGLRRPGEQHVQRLPLRGRLAGSLDPLQHLPRVIRGRVGGQATTTLHDVADHHDLKPDTAGLRLSSTLPRRTGRIKKHCFQFRGSTRGYLEETMRLTAGWRRSHPGFEFGAYAGPEERRRPRDALPSRQSDERCRSTRKSDQLDCSCRSCRRPTTWSSTTRASRAEQPGGRSSPISPSRGHRAPTARRPTFKLQEGVKRHRRPARFTAKDVVWTFDLLIAQGRGPAARATRARPGTATSTRSPPIATTRSTVHRNATAAPPPSLARLRATRRRRLRHMLPAADAHQADRHRPFKFVEFQAERRHQAH